MTREEAIYTLKNAAWLGTHEERVETEQAIDMAIEALKAKTDGDLISRQDAITIPVMPKEHRQYQTMNIDDAYERGWYDSQDCIESLPSAEAVHKPDYSYEAGMVRRLKEALSAEARPTGEWIDIDNYYRIATCSHCLKVTMFEKWGEYTKPYDFCPNCGTNMVKGGGSE